MPKLERAEANTDRGIRVETIKRDLRLLKLGALTCTCGRTATKLAGGFGESTRAYCAGCALNDSLNRRLARMRAERERMRRRT